MRWATDAGSPPLLGFRMLGMIGGFEKPLRMSVMGAPLKKRCSSTSSIPLTKPSLYFGSLAINFLMRLDNVLLMYSGN